MPAPILRPYQETCVAGLRAAFANGYKRPLLVSPTGSGKTQIFSHLTAKIDAGGKRVVLMVHRAELVEQISNTLTAYGVKHGFITAGAHYDKRQRIHVASVMTLAKRMAKGEVIRPDYAIGDEFHHFASTNICGRIIEEWDTRTIGVTATPMRLDGSGLRPSADIIVQGPTPAELMRAGYLAPYRLFAPPMQANLAGVHSVGGDYNRGELQTALDTPRITGDAIKHYRRLCDGAPAVAFCVSVEHAEHTAAQFRAEGYRAMSIDGKMDRGMRRDITREFASGGIHVLTSCDLISEGYDMPGIVAAILLRPTKSLGLCLQQIGRALRPKPDGGSAIILDHAGNTGRHGLPDDPREWTLDATKRKKGDAEKQVSARTCEYCFAVSPVWLSACRECHRPFPVASREVEHVDGELSEVDVAAAREAAMEAAERDKIDRLKERASAKTLEDLVKIGAARGYKPGWAQHVYESRQAKRPREISEGAREAVRRAGESMFGKTTVAESSHEF